MFSVFISIFILLKHGKLQSIIVSMSPLMYFMYVIRLFNKTITRDVLSN